MNISKFSFKSLLKAAVVGSVFMMAATTNAAVKDCLVVHTTDGEKTYYVLEDTPVVTFTGDNLHIKSASLEADVKFDNVKQFTFESRDVESVKDLTVGECRITVRNNEVTLEGFKAGSRVAVYAMNGVCVLADTIAQDGCATTLSLGHLDSGVYVVSTVSKSFKIVVK